MDLEYNSDREHLIIPEYGRHIQKLVNHCIKLEDKEVRNTMAKAIVLSIRLIQNQKERFYKPSLIQWTTLNLPLNIDFTGIIFRS